MDKTQKEKIREKWKDTTEIANKFLHYVKMSGNSVLNADAIADYWLNELDLAIKETEERMVREILDRIKDTIGINTNSVSDNLTLVKVFDDGGLCDFVDEKEYINKVDLIRFINLLRNK